MLDFLLVTASLPLVFTLALLTGLVLALGLLTYFLWESGSYLVEMVSA